jgi:hypothetical protein
VLPNRRLLRQFALRARVSEAKRNKNAWLNKIWLKTLAKVRDKMNSAAPQTAFCLVRTVRFGFSRRIL